jgi:hypothetical protein
MRFHQQKDDISNKQNIILVRTADRSTTGNHK